MITLTREEAQQVLDALEYKSHWVHLPIQMKDSIKTLRARLAEPELVKFNAVKACEYARGYRDGKAEQQLSAADNYAHRLALMLECMLLSPDKTWNAANNLVSEYHEALNKERIAAGDPYVSGFGKD